MAGAVTITAALMLVVYAIVNGNEIGWLSAQTLLMLGAAAVSASQTGLGVEAGAALNAGYQVAFKLGAAFAALAGCMSYIMLKNAIK